MENNNTIQPQTKITLTGIGEIFVEKIEFRKCRTTKQKEVSVVWKNTSGKFCWIALAAAERLKK